MVGMMLSQIRITGLIVRDSVMHIGMVVFVFAVFTIPSIVFPMTPVQCEQTLKTVAYQATSGKTAKESAGKKEKTTSSQVSTKDSSDQASENELGEGPEPLAEKFAKMLAEQLARKGGTDSAEELPESANSNKAVTVPAEPDVPPKKLKLSVVVLRSPKDLAGIARPVQIERLILTGKQFSNRSLRSLEGLSAATLSIEAVNVSNAGLQYVPRVRGVQRLRLWSPAIDDKAMKFVAELSKLEVFDVEGTAIVGTGFADLKNLQKLETVILGPKVTDTTVAGLGHLPALRNLDLRACHKLTMGCLQTLASLTKLKTLWLPGHLRTKGKRALKLTRPDCQVRS